MKKLLPILLTFILCCTSCGLESGSKSVSETSSVQGTASSILTSEFSVPQIIETSLPYKETAEYSEGVAQALYLHYLDKSFEQGIIDDYRLIGISVTTQINANESDFAFLAYYDVLPVVETDFNPGNGEKQDDGWITGKAVEVIAIRDLLSEDSIDGFAIQSQSVYTETWNKPDESLKHGIDADELKAEAKRLYTESLEESITTNHFIVNYKIHDICIEYLGNDYFDFSVNYDTLLANKNDATANGAIFKDGWVIGRYAYVVVHKINGQYVIDNQGTSMIMRKPDVIGNYLFSIYLEKNKESLSEYESIKEQVEYIGEDFFDYSVTFDLLPIGEDFMPGSGKKQADGWIRGKYVYIVMRDKGFGNYEIERMSSKKIHRNGQ